MRTLLGSVLGGFSAEYAQGVWPQMLSVVLCVGAFFCAELAVEEANLLYALLGGFLIGLACGVREQNAFLAACLGIVILIWSDKRWRNAGAYVLGIAGPLFASSVLNFNRLGLFDPFPKVISYTQLVTHTAHHTAWMRPLEVLLVKVIDFSSFVWFQDPAQFIDYAREPSSGAFLVAGTVKKALLQSSPWTALALVCCFTVWKRTEASPDSRTKMLRAISLLIVPTLVMFSMTGFRMEGLSFNQRYMLEILPFAAVVVALCVERMELSRVSLLIGFMLSAGAFALLLFDGSSQLQNTAVLKVPLVLGSMLILSWVLNSRPAMNKALAVSMGLCLGWSCMVQTSDLATSRRIRSTNAIGLDSLEAKIPNHAALFAFWGAQKSMAGPMQLNKDVVILDAWADNGRDAPLLKRELQGQGRRVFAFGTGMPPAIIEGIRGRDSLAAVLANPFVLCEIIPR